MIRDLLLDAHAGGVRITDPDGVMTDVAVAELPAVVSGLESDDVRWVWDSTFRWYPALLKAGVRIGRCWDVRLSHAILRGSEHVPADVREQLWPAPDAPNAHDRLDPWDGWDGALGTAAATQPAEEAPEGLFDLLPVGPVLDRATPDRDLVAELDRQRRALAAAPPDRAGRLRLLLAAESSGALAAAELRHDGLPFASAEHGRTLERLLGPRPRTLTRPPRLEALAQRIREILDAPRLNPDSQPHLLRELRRNGLDVSSTSKWELEGNEHPVVPVLLEYKSLARLASANGWAWMDTWVRGDRFRSDYVPAGVVTGRWSSRGGGALSLPKVIRSAVRADDGWDLVIVDAAQLEPRILAAMAGDHAMTAAGAEGDLYQGLVDAGVVDTRDHAKVAMLGALYGSTTGQSALLMPRLVRAYPRAIDLVDRAARTGEAGGVVTTWLGRSSPPPSRAWRETQAAASGADAGANEEQAARSRAREWGRFTRNFVVQGTAAEWALSWMAGVRRALRDLVDDDGARPHLAFFLHDELVVHTPAALVPAVTAAVDAASRQASRLVFPHLAVDPLVPLDVVVAHSYAEQEPEGPIDVADAEGTPPAPPVQSPERP